MRTPSPRPLGLAIISTLVVFSTASMPFVAAQTPGVTLTINSPRPVAKAIEELMDKYGYVITYEDPPYVYSGDLNDVTQQYRKDVKRFPPESAPRLWVPMGGALQVQLPSDTKPTEQDIQHTLQQLVQSQLDAGQGGGHFVVEEDGSTFHVVPTEVRDVNGNWQNVTSILATPISLANEIRTEDGTIKAVCDAVSAKTGVRLNPVIDSGVVMGLVQFGSTPRRYSLAAQNEPASSVLMRVFQLMGEKRTWLLYYDPTDHAYMLNIIKLPAPTPTSH